MKLNEPNTIVDEIDPNLVTEKWGEIKQIIKDEIPSVERLRELFALAHAATTPEEIAVSPELFRNGIRYHMFMRRRVTIMRVLPMADIDPLDVYEGK